jgi:putative membrane protein
MWGYGHDWGMMGGWGGGGFMFVWLLVFVALVAGVIWFVRSPSPSYAAAGRGELPRRSSGLDILEERYAHGEINRDEFLQKKKEIAG